MSVHEIFNYRAINAKLATSGIPSAEQLASLQSEGFEVVINLLPDDSEYATRNEQEIVTAQGIDYRYIPVDYAAPTVVDFTQFSRIMREVNDRKTLIHCAANFRVSAFYAGYAVRKGLWSQEQAAEFISSVWNPEEYPPWPDFIDTIMRAGE